MAVAVAAQPDNGPPAWRGARSEGAWVHRGKEHELITSTRLARLHGEALIKHSLARLASVTAVVCALSIGPAVSAAVADSPASASRWPIPASNSWHRYVEGDGASTVTPVAATAMGDVSNPRALVTGRGVTTLTWVAGQARPIVVLDYGKEVGGLPFFDVSSVTRPRRAHR